MGAHVALGEVQRVCRGTTVVHLAVVQPATGQHAAQDDGCHDDMP